MRSLTSRVTSRKSRSKYRVALLSALRRRARFACDRNAVYRYGDAGRRIGSKHRCNRVRHEEQQGGSGNFCSGICGQCVDRSESVLLRPHSVPRVSFFVRGMHTAPARCWLSTTPLEVAHGSWLTLLQTQTALRLLHGEPYRLFLRGRFI